MGIKEAKLNFILDKAKAMFIEKGIEAVKQPPAVFEPIVSTEGIQMSLFDIAG